MQGNPIMATATVPPPPLAEPPQHFVLDGVSYAQFVALTDALGERGGLRIAFDGERLELMTLSRRHERFKKLLGQLIEQLTNILRIPRESGGQMTFRNELVERGLEPDDCYWIQHALDIAGVDEWEPGVHPPPDLAAEIEVTRSRLDRPAIYARLKIPELWRFNGETLRAFVLSRGGVYKPIRFSRAFPFLRVADLTPFLLTPPPATETEIVAEFADWVREQGFPGH
jgi:Uma2 family endonuclease